MKILSISVGGFKNLKLTTIKLNSITAIISPNNYGKSNLLEAIDFGVDFLVSNAKDRASMMRWVRGIPINRAIENDNYYFSVEFEDEQLGEYRFVRYGFSFKWYRDDGTGQRITDEWIEIRPNESVRYTTFLKRNEGKYRKERDTSSFRNIAIDDYQLAIDFLIAMDDIAIQPVIKTISKMNYHVCSSLDLGDRFQPAPIEYVDQTRDGLIAFDDNDVPRALYQLKEQYPEKYNLLLEAVYSLFPEFSDVVVQSYALKIQNPTVNFLVSKVSNKNTSIEREQINEEENIPFKIRDELYRIIITNKYLNQPIDIAMMSTGTKRLFWLLVNVFVASARGMSLVGVEELETSIHPKLLKKLLEILDEILENTSLIISSHSPYLVQYIKADRLYIGVPNDDGTAEFKKTAKPKSLIRAARDRGMSVGEFLFELMSGDQDSIDTLSYFLED